MGARLARLEIASARYALKLPEAKLDPEALPFAVHADARQTSAVQLFVPATHAAAKGRRRR